MLLSSGNTSGKRRSVISVRIVCRYSKATVTCKGQSFIDRKTSISPKYVAFLNCLTFLRHKIFKILNLRWPSLGDHDVTRTSYDNINRVIWDTLYTV